MKCIDDHHVYHLETFLNEDDGHYLRFYKMEKDFSVDGVTNEEVIDVLIHRISGLNTKQPCRENSLAITKLQEALMWLEERTKDRIARGVEGKLEP